MSNQTLLVFVTFYELATHLGSISPTFLHGFFVQTSFSSLNVTRKRRLYEKRARKMLVKLTPVVILSFISIHYRKNLGDISIQKQG